MKTQVNVLVSAMRLEIGFRDLETPPQGLSEVNTQPKCLQELKKKALNRIKGPLLNSF